MGWQKHYDQKTRTLILYFYQQWVEGGGWFQVHESSVHGSFIEHLDHE